MTDQPKTPCYGADLWGAEPTSFVPYTVQDLADLARAAAHAIIHRNDSDGDDHA